MDKLKKIVINFRYYGRKLKGMTREQCNILADIYSMLIMPECSVKLEEADVKPVTETLKRCGLSVRQFRHNEQWIINVIK